MGLVLSGWLVFYGLPEEYFGQGEERGTTAVLLILGGIPMATILGAVVGLVVSFALRGSRLAAWATVVGLGVLAVTLFVAFSAAWNSFQPWFEKVSAAN